MSATVDETPRAATPWHLWVVGVASLLWNCFGGYDYTMSHVQGEAYFRQVGMTDAQIAFMTTGYPTWMHAVWAIGVWGSVAGSILLLLRMRWAFHAFALSSLGAIGSLLFVALTPAAQGGMGMSAAVFPAIIVVIVLLLTWYANAMTKRGVLR